MLKCSACPIAGESAIIQNSDFNVISNIYPAFQEAVWALIWDGKLGPYDVKVSPANFIHLLAIYTDGSGASVMSRMFEQMPLIASIKVDAELPDTAVFITSRGTNDEIRVYNRSWYGVPCVFCGQVIRAGETCPSCGGRQ